MTDQVIHILGVAADEEWRGPSQLLAKRGVISVENFRKQVGDFVASMDSVLTDLEGSASGFEVDEVEVSAALSISGEVSLLGMGAGAESNTGVKFVFRRKRS